MNMKTSPEDNSNQEVIKELQRLSGKLDASHSEVVEMIQVFSDKTDERFDRLEGRMGGLEGRMGGLEGRVDGMDHRLTKVESQMVTKSYLDDKLADLRSDIQQNTARQIEKALR